MIISKKIIPGKIPDFIIFLKKIRGTCVNVGITHGWRTVMTSGFFVIGWDGLESIIIDRYRGVTLSMRSTEFAAKVIF